jgi:plasmid stability protein
LSVDLPDDIGARLAAEAARRGTGIEATAADLLAPALTALDDDPLEAFIGSGDSGDPTWAARDIHELRSDLAARRNAT